MLGGRKHRSGWALANHLLAVRRHGFSEVPSDRRGDFVHLHGLRNVIVHACGNAKFAVTLHGIRRGRDDSGLAVRGKHLADLPRGLVAVHVRHLHIHQHKIIMAALQRDDRRETVRDGVRAVAEPSEETQRDLLVHGVVLRQQDIERDLVADPALRDWGGP
jgi:hypothetical protein